MIKVSVKRGKMVAKGHANFAPKGQDIVCAGITSVFTTTYSILENLSGDGNVDAIFEPGHLELNVRNKTLATDLIQAGMMEVLETFEKLYPENIKIEGEI